LKNKGSITCKQKLERNQQMKSNTKVQLDTQAVTALCAAAGLRDIERIEPMGAGEFNAVYAFDSGGRGYAMKIAPGADVPVMTYEQNMMRSEVFWYEQLRKHTDIQTPEIVYTDFSRSLLQSDFFIMSRIPGKQMNEMDLSPEEKAAATAMLPRMASQIHRIRHKGFGYPQCGYYDSWDQALVAMTEAIIRDADAMGKPCENGKKTIGFIHKHRDILRRAACRMVNFDLWEANILCERDGDGIQYTWIDPERGFWGDPMMDFICFETDKPLKDKRVSLAAYNQGAEHPVNIGREEEIRFAFAQAYLGLIMEVERYYRYVPGDEGWTRNDRVYETLIAGAFSCLETM
jgi:aminoglycoside phosphotransferase (APT) family kinase protein